MQFPIPPAQPVQQVTPVSPVSPGGDLLAGQLETKKTDIPQANSEQSLKSQIKSAAAGQAMTMNIVDGKIKLTPVGGSNASEDTSGKTSEDSFASESKAKSDDSSKKECDKAKVIDNVTLKGGKKAGKFNNHGDVNGMDDCQDICCKDKKCHVAFMLGKTCYSVTCKTKDLCEHTKAPPSDYNPQLAYVRKMDTSNSKGEFIWTLKNWFTHFPSLHAKLSAMIKIRDHNACVNCIQKWVFLRRKTRYNLEVRGKLML